jgi:NAD(P)-dependent dehydrogenase (short-subunit alcohol dehydrogenase family)
MLKDQVIIVTGASRGIGKAMVAALAKRGVCVVAAARSLGAEQPGPPGAALSVAVDVRDPDQVKNLVQQVVGRYQRVDGLVNNAGLMVGDIAFTDTDPDLYQTILDTNLKGAFLTCWAVVPHLLRQGHGTIINITSGAAVRTGFLNIPYGISKAGLDRLTLGLGAELQEQGIACVSLSPPVSTTDTVRKMYAGRDMDGWAHPPELTAHALWLLLEDNPIQYTGQVISVREYLQQQGGLA